MYIMKKLLFVFLLLATIAANSQSGPTAGNYLPINSTGYNWAWGYFRSLGLPGYSGVPNGTSTFQPKQYWGDGAIYRDTVGHKTYVFNGETKVWDEIGGSVSVPGNFGDVLINRAGLATPASDSLKYDAGILKILGSVNIGPSFSTSTAENRIGQNGNNTPILIVGRDPIANATKNGIILSPIDTVTTTTGQFVVGTDAVRSTYVNGNNLTFAFRYGFTAGYRYFVKDSMRLSNQNNDGNSSASLGYEWRKYPGQTTRSAVVSGGSAFDHSSSLLVNFSFSGTTSTNNFRLRGWYSNINTYIISDNPGHTDSIDNFSAVYTSGAGATLGPKIKFYRAFVTSAMGGDGSNIYGAYYSFYGMNSGIGKQAHFFNEGSARIGGSSASNFDGDNGVDTATNGSKLQVDGPVLINDGTQAVGYIFYSDANGKGIWKPQVRTNGVASASTVTPDIDSYSQYSVTALAANVTFAAPTGTPTDGQVLTIRIKDNGTSRTITWNSIYRAGTDIALPSSTTISKTMYAQFNFNAADTKWDFVGLTSGF